MDDDEDMETDMTEIKYTQWRVQATANYQTADGYSATRQIPTFIIDGVLLGISNAETVRQVAEEITNPSGSHVMSITVERVEDLAIDAEDSVTDEIVDTVLGNYLIAALWSCAAPDDADGCGDSNGHMEDYFDPDDLTDADHALAVWNEVRDFINANRADLEACGLSWEQIGHDFWLTRNGHGTGFWDRGIGEYGTRLTAACKACGSVSAEPDMWREVRDDDDLEHLDQEVAVRDQSGTVSIFNYNDGGYRIVDG